MAPFNDWYHHTEFTHWTGLPGPDAEPIPLLIPGVDYKTPSLRRWHDPFDRYTKAPQFSKAEILRFALREFALKCILACFHEHRIEAMAVSVTATQVNILARFPDHQPRHWLGLAKRHATVATRRLFELPNLRIWTKPGLLKPITDQTHLINARDYISAHGRRDAAVWNP